MMLVEVTVTQRARVDFHNYDDSRGHLIKMWNRYLRSLDLSPT